MFRARHSLAGERMTIVARATADFVWKGDRLFLGRRFIISIERDAKWLQMWRVRCPDGRPSDMVNRIRAKDAAQFIALRHVNQSTEIAAE
jgi:hypothetical protein